MPVGRSAASRTSPSLALVAGFWPRGAPYCCALWCVAAAKAMRTVCCSCRHHERSRRSRRRLATPPAEGRTLDSAIISQLNVGKKKNSTVTNLVEPGGGGGGVGVWWCGVCVWGCVGVCGCVWVRVGAHGCVCGCRCVWVCVGVCVGVGCVVWWVVVVVVRDVMYDVRVYPCTPTVMQLIKMDQCHCTGPFGWTDQPEKSLSLFPAKAGSRLPQ